MDQEKTGKLIRTLRTQCGLTQKTLAEAVGVGDKAVSKWERGLGCPDVSLLPELSRVLGVGLEALLSGELDANDQERGNMKKLQFYVQLREFHHFRIGGRSVLLRQDAAPAGGPKSGGRK